MAYFRLNMCFRRSQHSLFAHAQWHSPRESLNRIWQTTGGFISIFETSVVVVTCLQVVATPKDEVSIRVIYWQTARNLSWLFIGVMHAPPKFRTTIHSALLARGGQARRHAKGGYDSTTAIEIVTVIATIRRNGEIRSGDGPVVAARRACSVAAARAARPYDSKRDSARGSKRALDRQ